MDFIVSPIINDMVSPILSFIQAGGKIFNDTAYTIEVYQDTTYTNEVYQEHVI